MNEIKAVVFDLDGVLIEAKDWHYEALNRALALFGMEISRYDHLVTYDGLPTRRKLEMLTLERGLPTELHDFINEKKQHYTMEIINAKCHPVFVHQYLLSRLKRSGYRLAVCSNSIRESVQVMLKRADLLRYLEFFLSNQDVEKPKPDPDIYLKAFEKLGCKPSECLVIEDNENGIKAAQSAGAYLLAVTSVHDVNCDNVYDALRKIREGVAIC